MILNQTSMEFLTALQDVGLPARGAAGNKARYTRELTAEEQTAADLVMAEYNGVGLATIDAIGMDITATVGQDDTTATFTVLDSEGVVSFGPVTVDVINGECSYTLATNIADTYTVRVCGIISYMSAHCEVEVTP